MGFFSSFFGFEAPFAISYPFQWTNTSLYFYYALKVFNIKPGYVVEWILMITYYTDGSCSPNPGPGGFAVIKDVELTIVGHEPVSTNIRMEGRAIMAALNDAEGNPCMIYSDSEFWVNVITKWGGNWETNGWTKKNGEIKNLDIVKEVCRLHKISDAKLIWVRGHVGNITNELADKWANKAREERLTGKFLL